MSGERYTVDHRTVIDRDGGIAYCTSERFAIDIATSLNRESAVSELLAALEAFADVAGVVNTTVPDECCVDILMSKHLPTVGDCRRAAEAVQKWESGT